MELLVQEGFTWDSHRPTSTGGGGGGGGAIAGSNEVVDRIRSNYYFLIQGHVCLFYFFSLNYW